MWRRVCRYRSRTFVADETADDAGKHTFASVNSALQRACETLGKPQSSLHRRSQPCANIWMPSSATTYLHSQLYCALRGLFHATVPALASGFRRHSWLHAGHRLGWLQLAPCSRCSLRQPNVFSIPAEPSRGFRVRGLMLLEFGGDRIAATSTFLDADRLFPCFGLQRTLPSGASLPPDR